MLCFSRLSDACKTKSLRRRSGKKAGGQIVHRGAALDTLVGSDWGRQSGGKEASAQGNA
jgi:hypothetical protein